MTERRDPSPHNALIRFWCDTYQEHTGAKYPFQGGKDAKTIQWLRELYTDEEIQAYMRAYFAMDDPFFEETGHSLSVFRGSLPKIIKFANGGSRKRSMSDAAANVFRVLGGGKA